MSLCPADIDSLQDRAHWFGIDSLQSSVWFTSIADEIVPIGLALIIYKLVSVLKSIADEIVSGFRHWKQSETELYLDRYGFEKPLWSRTFTSVEPV